MKGRRRRWRPLIFFAVAIGVIWALWAALLPPTPAAAGNMLANPGFEQENKGMPAGWNFDASARQKGTISLTTNRASGERALRLQPNRSNPNNLLALNVAQGFQIGPLEGKTLEIAASLAAEEGATAVFGVWAVDRTGAIVASEQVSSTSRTYERKETRFEVPSGSNAILLVVECQVLGQSGSAYFDDVRVEASSGAAQAAPPANAPAGPLQATVTVDARKVLRRVPRTVYGQNISWVYGGSLLVDFRTNRLNEELVRLTKELNVPLLRFPGGSFADFYHWRDGVGPLEARKETQHQPGEAKSRHIFGTDEALTFAERVGAHLLMTVNIHTGTPEEAADWVRYVNKQGPSRRVDYWEIGNESYIKNDSPANAAMPPDEYVKRLQAFARAMRQADPDIKLLAIGGENFGRYTSNNYPGWNQKVLSDASGSIDYLALHNAYFPAILAEQGLTDVRRVYKAMLAAPVLIKQNLDTVAHQLARYGDKRPLKLAITEWGPIFHFDPGNAWVDHVKTLGSALYVASTMKVFLEHPAVEIANAFKLNDIAFMGWIGARYSDVVARPPADGLYLPTAPYLAFQLFTRYFGSTVVDTATVVPTFDSAALGMTAAVSGAPYLDVVSSVSDDGQTMYVIGVNKHFDQAIDARVALNGFKPQGRATVRTLQGSGLDANTGTKLPSGMKWAKQVQDRSNPRFDKGSPDDVKVTESSAAVASAFTFRFPPHSVTALQIAGATDAPARAPRR